MHIRCNHISESESKPSTFKGSALVSALLEIDRKRFQNRAVALHFARRLFRLGLVRSIFGASNFEDSVQVYCWHNGNDEEVHSTEPRRKSSPNVTQRSSWMTNAESSPPLSNNLPNSYYNSIHSKRLHSSPHHTDQNHTLSKNRPHVDSQFVNIVRTKLLSIGEPTTLNSYPYSDTLESNQTKLRTDHGLSRIRKSNKAFQPHTCITPHSLTPDSLNKEAAILSSSRLYQDRVINERHKNIISPEMEDVATAKYLNEKDIFDLRYDTSSKSVEGQVFQMCRDDCEIPPLRMSGGSSTGSNSGNAVVNGRSVWSSGGVVGSGGGGCSSNNGGGNSNGGGVGSGGCSNSGGGGGSNSSGGSNGSTGGGAVNGSGGGGDGGGGSGGGEPCSSYSDNEKQLIEEITRIKREHENVLRTYEDRISRMTAKMHELRNIAEMLENSSNKSLPYGVIQGKGGQTSHNGQSNHHPHQLQQQHHHHLNHHNHNNQHHQHQQNGNSSVTCHAPGHCTDTETKSSTQNTDKTAPPPLPPRNDRGTAKVYPNKPLIYNKVKLTQVPWTRIITNPDDENMKGTIWNTLGETDIDTQEIDRFFEEYPTKSTVFIQSLYDDVSLRCGTLKPQPISIIDSTKCQQMAQQMKQVRCTFSDVVHALLTLSIETLRFANAESLSELFQLMSSGNDIEIITQQDRRISNVQMDCPEYFLYELSGMEMLRERLDFLRFKLRFLTDLFETDQRLRAVNAACDELYNSLPLKNLIEVVVCVGNYMNGGTPLGQADGFHLDILPKLKDILAKNNKSNFLEYVLTTYCQKFENEPGLQTNRTFRLPNAIVVRYASQISFDEMQKNLQGWKNELINTRNKIHSNLAISTSRQVEGFRNAVDYFLSAGMETMEEQKKFLYDTKDYCIKLLSYFSFEMNGQGSIQQFFLMWSQFLHECKHYWKISHQRLAEERFRKGLNQKIKMMNINNMDKFTIPSSCPDLPPRMRKPKSSTEKHPPPPINITHKKWEDVSSENLRLHQLGTASHNHQNGCSNNDTSNQFHHHHLSLNTLPTSSQSNTNSQHGQHIKACKSREDLHDFHAQPSPKLLTSRPPTTSDIHKPKPLNPVPTSHEGSPLLGLCHKPPMINNVASHNYMNQSPLAVRPTSSPVVANSGTTANPMEVAEVAPKRPPPPHLHHHQANTLTSRETPGVAVPSTATTPMVHSVSNSNSSSSHHHHHSSSTGTSVSSSGGTNKNGTNNNGTTMNAHLESTVQKKSTHQLFKSWLKREQTKTNSGEQGTLSCKLSSNDKSKVTAFKPVGHGAEEPVRAPKIYTRAKTSLSDNRDGHHSSHDLTSSGNSSKSGSTSSGQELGNSDAKQCQSHSKSSTNRHGSKDQLYSPRYEQSPVSNSEKLTLTSEKKPASGEENSQHQTSRNHYQHFSGPSSPQKSAPDSSPWNNGHLPLTSTLTSSASSHRNYQNDVELITGSSTTPKSYTSNNQLGQQYHNINGSNSNNKPRDRAPIALGSNVGISDIHRSELLSKNGVTDSVGSDRTIEKVSNQPVPTGHSHSKSNSATVSSMGSYAHEIQTKSRKYFTTNAAQQSTTNNMTGVLGCRSQSSHILKNLSGISSDLRGGGTQGSSLGSSGSTNGSSGQHRSSSAYSYSQKMAREEAAVAASTRIGHHTEGRSSKLAAVNGDRLPTSAPSISSLIERFEKVQYVGDSSVKHAAPKMNGANCDVKHMALASTPVSSRKRLFGELGGTTSTSTTPASTNKPKSNVEDADSSEDEYAVQLDRSVSPHQNLNSEDSRGRQKYQTMDLANRRKPVQNEYSPVNDENANSLLPGSYETDNFDPTNDYTPQLRESAKSSNILSERYPNIQQAPERPPPLVTSSTAMALANQKGQNKRVIRAHENMAYMAV